jgi:hypothetical protein
MRRLLSFTGPAMLLIATSAFAAQAKPTVAPPKPAPVAAAAAKPAKVVWAAGTIERFDATAKTLVIKQGTHEMTFTLATAAQVVEGKKGMHESDLTSGVGKQVRVRYTETGGTKTASRIELSTPAPKK